MDTIKSILHPTDDDRVWSCDNFEHSTYHNSYQVEFKLPKNNDKTRIVQVWCCVEKDVTTGEKALLGIIQNVTESVLLQKEIGSAKSLLQLQMDEKEYEISAAIKKLNREVESRKKCQLELRALNKSIALDAQSHKSFVKKHTFQLRSLISRIASETNCTPSAKPNTLPNVLNRILPKIDDLSDFISRTESIVSDKEPVITSRLFYNIIEIFKDDAAAKSLSLNCSQAPDDPDTILTDKRRLRQILTAIMELFVQNTKWGTIQLTHTIDTTTTPRLVVSFYAPSTMHPVTRTMFFPEQEITEHTSQINPVQMVGTLIEALAGEFSITTTTGTDFSITLRFPISLASKDLPPTPEKKFSGMTALIVEDDPYSLMYATKIMQDAGFDVDSAKNGSEAIEHLKEKRFSIILLDIQLPDMDGVFITESIRNDANSANQSTPIIAITAHGSSSDHQTFIRTGINKVITKPFDKDRLLYTAIRLCSSPQ